ncbi:hypothetical protein BU16DRAFT_559836 [Lophium mytilinum]|uniref:Uncharacterized protein n=1 Tax=Lophium mytilinum TaxID=390894 RepID=A0A6A6R0T8_9PEZI|nr:hypothetical protein BU16DRAFT_559836 [Lophium mytilinum]
MVPASLHLHRGGHSLLALFTEETSLTMTSLLFSTGVGAAHFLLCTGGRGLFTPRFKPRMGTDSTSCLSTPSAPVRGPSSNMLGGTSEPSHNLNDWYPLTFSDSPS